MKDTILRQFDDNYYIFESLSEKCKLTILELLKDTNISVHQIRSRIKDRESLSKKIDDKKNKYQDISEITDICGVRIITYLDSDVNKVAEIIEKEFEIDLENSTDKRQLKIDQFGYKSLHYVVSLGKQRLRLTENRKYSNRKLEIQIRSILQHAWAEIEHDLGYKGEISIPDDFKRSFNRLAALLESADLEFDRLKKDLLEYETNITKIIESEPHEVEINQTSLLSFVNSNKILNEARKIIASNTGCQFLLKTDVLGELERFEFFKINTIGELEKLVKDNKNHFLAFVDKATKNLSEKTFSFTIPLFYFQHFLAAKSMNKEYVEEYLSWGNHILGGSLNAEYFIDVYNSTSNANQE